MIGSEHREPIAILISGRGSNMRALIERSRHRASGYQVVGVFCDQPAAAGLDLARDLGVPARVIAAVKSAGRAAYDVELWAAIDECAPKLIVLAGFMRILSAEFVSRYEGRILNIHPSLLPKHRGLHTHQRALEAGDATHGATVHFVTEELDGGPPILQARVHVNSGDTAESLAERVQVLEHRIYPLAVRWYCTGRLRYSGGRAWLDGAELLSPVQYDDAEDR